MSLAIFVSFFFLYSLISQRVEQTILTAPIVFTVAGMLMFPAWPAILRIGVNADVLSWLAEIGLVLLLFTDASRTGLNVLGTIGNLATRLLSIGMLLTILFGAGLVAVQAWPQFSLAVVLYAALSLTVVRMLPVAIALIGTRLNLASVVFMGWFGPRGLASIVLGLVYLEQEAHLPGEAAIRLALIVTVLLSIFAHGLSATPGIRLYAHSIGSPDATR